MTSFSFGDPINGVRWWGSHFDPQRGPGIPDGFLISFFRDIPAGAGGIPFSRPDSSPSGLLGSYLAPIGATNPTPTGLVGWDNHDVWEYQVHFNQTHLDHPSSFSTPNTFNPLDGAIYWISIAAQNGHALDPGTWQFVDTGDPIENQHFWGWHTSPDSFNDVPTMSSLIMPGNEWNYLEDWTPTNPQHFNSDQAFELWTPEPASSSLLLIALACGAVRRKRVA